ncbi:DUF1059 domain-containing protein [Ruegeria hyattellae]|uniref:DUF1059 domain-containing protein n=1 Tax=Ruegeria hyattellae TaxID=3233337 RepID=UPI00355B7B61
MTKAYSYSCRHCEGMEACPASIVANTKEELLEMIGHHARLAHGENSDDWDQDTREYLNSLIVAVEVDCKVSV